VKRAILSVSTLRTRFWLWLPDRIDRRVRTMAWLSVIFQTVLIGTGGAVRLTASGLGCPTWPRCTADSFVATQEMGLHGVIEFGNRLLTFVLVFIAIAAFLSVIRMRTQRRDLFVLTFFQGLSIPLQAVLGGITVLTGLNPYIVGLHFVVSIVLVALTTTLVFRVYRGPRGKLASVPTWFSRITHLTAALVAITVVMGILTTGSGPHAGDIDTPRNGLDAEFLQHLHSWPAYATFGLTVALVAATFIPRIGLERLRRVTLSLLVVEVIQMIVGITQARLGLPELLVGIHMVLAAALVSAMTTTVLSLRTPAVRFASTNVAAPRTTDSIPVTATDVSA